MIDHIKTAAHLETIATRILEITSPHTPDTQFHKTGKAARANLLALAAWHLNEVAKPNTKNEAETLLASSCEALRENLIATIQSGNEESTYRDLAALINDVDNYFIESLSCSDSTHGWTPATDAPDNLIDVIVLTENGTIHRAVFQAVSGYWYDTFTAAQIPLVSYWRHLDFPESAMPTSEKHLSQLF